MRIARKEARKFEDCKIESNPQKALLEACSEGSAERVEALLKAKKVDVTVTDQEIEKTPLYVTVSNYLDDDKTSGHREVLELLLKNGANPYAADHTGLTIAAKIFNETPLADILLDYLTDLSKPLDSYGMTALHLAVKFCPEDIVRKLLEKNAEVNSTNNRGSTVLHTAVSNDRLELIDTFVDRGAVVNKSDVEGWRPLHFAMSGSMVRKLVDHGAFLDTRCLVYKETPLFTAVRCRRKCEVISALLDCGANYEIIKPKSKYTPFDYIQRQIVTGHDLMVYGPLAEVFVQHVRSKVPDCIDYGATKRIRNFDREFEKAKTEKMGNSTVTFWQMITASDEVAAKYLCNEDIIEAMNNHKYDLFKWAISRIFYKGLNRKESEDYIRKSLHDIFQDKLPIHILDIIISYLTMKDLNVLGTLYNQENGIE